MNIYLLVAGVICCLLGLLHSVLGELLIFKNLNGPQQSLLPENPPLKTRHVRALRATWHVLTLFGFCFGVILLWLSWPNAPIGPIDFIKGTIITTFLIIAVYWIYGTRGKHPAWVIFIAMALLIFFA